MRIFSAFFLYNLMVINVNDFIIKTNNGRCLYLFEKNGLCMKELNGFPNRYKLIYPELSGDFYAVDTGFGELGIVCQNKEGGIVFIRENNKEFIKTVLLNSKSKLVYDKNFVLLMHGRWLGISYIIEYNGNNMLSFQLADNENEPPLAVDYITGKNYYTCVDNEYNRIFIYNRDKELGFNVFKWSQKKVTGYEKLCEGELICALKGFSEKIYLVIRKQEDFFLTILEKSADNMISEEYPLEFLQKNDDLTLMLDNKNLWITVKRKEFTFAYKTDMEKISFSSRYSIFTDGAVIKIKTAFNDNDKKINECFGVIRDFVPELVLYKDLNKVRRIASDDGRKSEETEKQRLKRQLEKIEIRLRLLEEKEVRGKGETNFKNE